ncbi:GrpB family protein [Microbacterium gallinarum]|uniref:GrpB family protein n=1 Tax=Microbacterium gallinarum TaxID=2762209 RepID=A0ABR8X4M2_9MICO|nr:GrpB family protein [Microbacterium gallinarum]MBD8024272.1 GrpB family protein [Microbacterium gallinarum]
MKDRLVVDPGLVGGRVCGVPVHPLWRPSALKGNADRQSSRVSFRQTEPGELQLHQAAWARDFRVIELLLHSTIPEQIEAVRHVGSTAVPGLLAKPVIDIDLTVRDVSDEPSYIPRLEAAGFRLIFRDRLGGDEHRQLTLADPNVNLHVWDADASEPQRHELFVAWLRSSPSDREMYTQAKLDAVAAAGAGRYNDHKSAAVYDIYERAFAADPHRNHDPQPRT